MAISFRIASTAAATATSVAPAKPTGLADGDVLVAVSNVDANETITAPGDWTACFAQEQTGSQTVRAWYRVVASAAGEPSTYTFGGTASVARRTTIVCYSGVDNTTPMDVTALASNNASSTTVHAASITTVTNNAVCVWAGAYDSSTFTVTKPAACTVRDAGASLYRMALADLAMPTAGATGSQDGSASTARVNVGMLIALRPAGTVTTVAVPTATATGAAGVSTERGIAPAPVATATGSAPTPTERLVAQTPVATATGSAPAPTERLIAQVPTATATGSCPTPTPITQTTIFTDSFTRADTSSGIGSPWADDAGVKISSNTMVVNYAGVGAAYPEVVIAHARVDAIHAIISFGSPSDLTGFALICGIPADGDLGGNPAGAYNTMVHTTIFPSAVSTNVYTAGSAGSPLATALLALATDGSQYYVICTFVRATSQVSVAIYTYPAFTYVNGYATGTDASINAALGDGVKFEHYNGDAGDSHAEAYDYVVVLGALPVTVSVPLATGTGTGLVPTVTGPSTTTTVTVPLATATGSALTPTDQVRTGPPLATATGAAVTPTQRAIASIPLATGTGAAQAPTVQAVVATPLATGSGQAFGPASRVLVPLATASGAANATTILANQPVPLSTAAGAAPAPTIVATIPAPLSTATGSAPTPTVLAVVAVPAATATGQAYGPAAYVYPPVASGTGTALAPTERLTASAPLAPASGQAFAPTLAAVVAVPVPAAAGTALAPSAQLIVALPVATATGQAYPSTTYVQIPTAIASGQAGSPTIVAIAAVPTVVAVGAALAPSLVALVPVSTSTATGAAFAPTLAGTATFVQPPTATANGDASAPTIIASVPVPSSTATGAAALSTQRLTIAPPLATATGAGQAPTLRIIGQVGGNPPINTGFETNTTGWVASAAGTTITRDTAEHHSGVASARIDGTNSGAGAILSQTPVIAAFPGEQWRFRIWAKGTGTVLARISARNDANGTVQNTDSAPFVLDANWQLLSVVATLAGAGITRINPWILTNSAQVVTFYLDDADVLAGYPAAAGAGLSPSVQAVVSVPVATAAGDAFSPSLLGVGAFSAPPTAVGTATAASPVVAVQGVIPLTTATADAVVPAPLLNVSALTATATGAAPAPTISGGGAFVAAPTATATGAAISPALIAAIPVPLSTGSGAALVPAPRAVIGVPVATASAQAATPTVTGTGAFVQPPTATGSAPAAPPLIAAKIASPAATGAGDAFPLTLRITISAPIALATAAGLPLTVVAIVPLPVASATGDGRTPTVIQAGGVIPIPVIVLTMPGRSPLAVPAGARMPLVVGATVPATVPERGSALTMPKGAGVLTGDE